MCCCKILVAGITVSGYPSCERLQPGQTQPCVGWQETQDRPSLLWTDSGCILSKLYRWALWELLGREISEGIKDKNMELEIIWGWELKKEDKLQTHGGSPKRREKQMLNDRGESQVR